MPVAPCSRNRNRLAEPSVFHQLPFGSGRSSRFVYRLLRPSRSSNQSKKFFHIAFSSVYPAIRMDATQQESCKNGCFLLSLVVDLEDAIFCNAIFLITVE